jgi:hypothetical protein
MRNSKTLVVYMLVSSIACLCIAPACFGTSETEAQDKIGQTEHNLGLAFIAVSEAQVAGGNMSAVSMKLGNAVELLAGANNALRIGDYQNASMLATQCNETLTGVVEDANAVKAQAETSHKDQLVITAFLSGVGLCLLLAFGLIGWSLLRRRYFRGILKARPVVVMSE